MSEGLVALRARVGGYIVRVYMGRKVNARGVESWPDNPSDTVLTLATFSRWCHNAYGQLPTAEPDGSAREAYCPETATLGSGQCGSSVGILGSLAIRYIFPE